MSELVAFVITLNADARARRAFALARGVPRTGEIRTRLEAQRAERRDAVADEVYRRAWWREP